MIELNFLKGTIRQEFMGDYELLLTVPKDQKSVIEPLYDLLTDDKVKTVRIDHYKKKRSLNANNYLWQIVTQIADKLRASKEEIYLQMLKRYGQSAMYTLLDEVVPTLPKTFKYYEIVREHAELNGKLYTHVKVFIGSSFYDTREMSILIDGVISEAEALGIPTITPAEIQRLKDNWKGEL